MMNAAGKKIIANYFYVLCNFFESKVNLGEERSTVDLEGENGLQKKGRQGQMRKQKKRGVKTAVKVIIIIILIFISPSMRNRRNEGQ
jgi:hypothetical protein